MFHPQTYLKELLEDIVQQEGKSTRREFLKRKRDGDKLLFCVTSGPVSLLPILSTGCVFTYPWGGGSKVNQGSCPDHPQQALSVLSTIHHGSGETTHQIERRSWERGQTPLPLTPSDQAPAGRGSLSGPHTLQL